MAAGQDDDIRPARGCYVVAPQLFSKSIRIRYPDIDFLGETHTYISRITYFFSGFETLTAYFKKGGLGEGLTSYCLTSYY